MLSKPIASPRGLARGCRAALPRRSPAAPRADGARHPPKLSAALLVQDAIARARALQDVAEWNKTGLTVEGNGKHRLQIGDILDRGSKKQPEPGVIIRVAKVTDDNTLAFAPALLWEGQDAVDETTEYTSKLAKWRKQFKNWHKDSPRSLQLGLDTILEAIKKACVRPLILVLRPLPRRMGRLKRRSSDSWGYASVS
eukprot:COSAG02_NODE_5228_length_4524_cov_1.960000_3_plen_196_part_01